MGLGFSHVEPFARASAIHTIPSPDISPYGSGQQSIFPCVISDGPILGIECGGDPDIDPPEHYYPYDGVPKMVPPILGTPL